MNKVAGRVNTIRHEIADEKGLDIQNLTIQSDHVNLFVSSPPKHSQALLANCSKEISSPKYNHRHADHDIENTHLTLAHYAGTTVHVSN